MNLRQEKSITTLIRSSKTLTSFQKKVFLETIKVKRGDICSYKELANRINMPKAYRAVANALGVNLFSPHVPCHRIIRSDKSLGGFSLAGGVLLKKKMLKAEGLTIKGNIVIMRSQNVAKGI